jgi:hypothetical protein
MKRMKEGVVCGIETRKYCCVVLLVPWRIQKRGLGHSWAVEGTVGELRKKTWNLKNK